MTPAASPTLKDQELIPFGLVGTTSQNSIADFVTSNSIETEANEAKKKNDFINIFICHLIFYAVFCISLLLHILIDLGLGTFIKNKSFQLIEMVRNIDVQKNPAFA